MVQAIVLDCASISYMDLSGAETLHEYLRALHDDGIETYGIYMHKSILNRFERIGALDILIPVHNIAEMRAKLGISVEKE